MRSCDGCTMCCKLLGVKSLQKQPDTWCAHCKPGTGCAIYPQRPVDCAGFDCLWRLGAIDAALRPDETKAVFALTEYDWLVQVLVDRHSAWRGTTVERGIDALRAKGINVIVCQGRERFLLQSWRAPLLDAMAPLSPERAMS